MLNAKVMRRARHQHTQTCSCLDLARRRQNRAFLWGEAGQQANAGVCRLLGGASGKRRNTRDTPKTTAVDVVGEVMERARETRWLFVLSSTLYPRLSQVCNGERHFDSAERQYEVSFPLVVIGCACIATAAIFGGRWELCLLAGSTRRAVE